MRRQVQGLSGLMQREAMADQPFQIHFSIHHKTSRLFLQVDGRAVRTDQSLFIDANRGWIDHSLTVLRLSKKQYSASGTGRVHSGANQIVAADSENDRVGAPAFG